MNKVFLHRIAPSCVRDASSFTMWIRFTRGRALLQEEPPKSKAKYFLFRFMEATEMYQFILFAHISFTEIKTRCNLVTVSETN